MRNCEFKSFFVALVICYLAVQSSNSVLHASDKPIHVQQKPSKSPVQADQSQKAKLLFFTANWCLPCKEIKPVLEKLSEEYCELFEFLVIDYDQYPFEVEKFKVKVLPTTILLDREEKLLIRVEGATKEGLEALTSQIKALKKSSIDKTD